MNDERMQPLLDAWFHDRDEAARDASGDIARVIADVPRTRQQGRWWPLPALDRPAPIPATNGRQPARGSTMFSAVKFVVAGVIVALFSGFLLTGILTTQQGDEVVPGAVTESPGPEVTSEPTEAPTTSVRTDILPGVALTVEEVEPDVFRVIDDGLRDLAKATNLDIVAGHDGGIWLLRPRRFFRLGGDEWHAWPIGGEVGDFEVAPDGTVWALSEGHSAWPRFRLYSVAGGSDDWTLSMGRARIFEVTSDGTVWAVWRDGPEPDSWVIGYLGADDWQSVGEWPFDGLGTFLVSDRGEVWAVRPWASHSRYVQHFVDGAWRTSDELNWRGDVYDTAVGADGTLWSTTTRGTFLRFDGTEWMTFESPDWNPTDLGDREWGEPHVAPDGFLWVPPRTSRCEDPGIDGVARFDGKTWSRFLQGRCVEAMDIAADGSVWLLASKSDAQYHDRDGAGRGVLVARHLYVITPEAGAADE